MKLYELAPSPSARRVAIFIKELGLEIESVHVDIRGGENLTAQFMEMSANGRIPLLELDDETYICESVAICRYLEATNATDLNQRSLFGESALDQATVEMWHRMVEFQGLFPAMQAFRNITGLYKDRENIVPQWGDESRARVISFLPTLNAKLASSEFIAGKYFSIADIAAVVMINFCKNIEIEVPKELTYLTSWFEVVSARDSVKAEISN